MLGQLRNDLGRPPVHEGPYRYVWVVDFPMFVGVDADTGSPKPGHHPFTRPHPDDLDRLETDPMAVRSQAYDLVLNGWELGSGSIRIHEPELQQRVFDLLGIDEEEADRGSASSSTRSSYGAPPHGGFAFGIDRLVAILAGEENIREVIAFPKTQSGTDPMTDVADPGRRRTTRHPRFAPLPASPDRSVGSQPCVRCGLLTIGRNLAGWTFAPRFTEVPEGDGDGGALRVHHVDEGRGPRARSWCMHGEPSWAYLYRKMIPVFTGAGFRAVAPDLVGFGRSDKPTDLDDYTYQRHVDWMTRLARRRRSAATSSLVCQDWGGADRLASARGEP